jgi:pimeloyl-ACP methyl ester carboxylesterase
LVDLIGLCQGGWLSLVYAGRFPAKVRKLVMAGAPVDIAARQSRLSAIAEATPLIMFQSLVNLGNGRVIGRNIAKFWGNDTDRAEGEVFWSRPPQDFYLLPQYPNFRLKRCPATEIAGAGLDVSR